MVVLWICPRSSIFLRILKDGLMMNDNEKRVLESDFGGSLQCYVGWWIGSVSVEI